uniref:Uncharacterized protein n=1 Tax=Triticum urartu TaxID=4572 RepID=A0A8R7PC46_TRIUA
MVQRTKALVQCSPDATLSKWLLSAMLRHQTMLSRQMHLHHKATMFAAQSPVHIFIHTTQHLESVALKKFGLRSVQKN